MAEYRITTLVKDYRLLINLSKLKGDEETLGDIVGKGKKTRPAPMAPAAFRQLIETGIEDGTIKVPDPGDVDTITEMYKRAFLGEMSIATELNYSSLDWGDAQISELSAALASAHAERSLDHLANLILDHNKISDLGLASIVEAATAGAMANLDILNLSYNLIEDVIPLANAMTEKGALPLATSVDFIRNPCDAGPVRKIMKDRDGSFGRS